jgi:hypothetical protein
MNRLRYLAAQKPALNLANRLCRIVLFPSNIPPAAMPVLQAAFGADDTFEGLLDAPDSRLFSR